MSRVEIKQKQITFEVVLIKRRGGGGRDRMMVEFTKVVSSNPIHGEVYSIHHSVIKFVSNLRQVGGFLRVLQ